MKLNLGSCTTKVDGFLSVDFDLGVKPDVVADIRKLPFPSNSIDEILASHILEHFPWTDDPLREWYRVLKPGSKITVCVPNIYLSAMLCESGRINHTWLADLCFGMGNGIKRGTEHFRAYTPRVLTQEFLSHGFEMPMEIPASTCPLLNSGIPEQLVMEGVKPLNLTNSTT